MSQIFKKIDVEIKGLTPLLMNRLNPDSLESKSKKKMEQYSTDTDAANSAYMAEVDGEKFLYIPQEAVQSMIIKTAGQYKIKRTSLSSLLAGTLRVEPAKISLGTDKYEVDKRAVVIQQQRVLKGRARIPEGWRVKFQLVYNTKYLPAGIEATLKDILEDAGVRMGLLDYRPQHKGWFGTFEVVSFKLPDGTELVKPQEVVAE